jgi:hypothetical protein
MSDGLFHRRRLRWLPVGDAVYVGAFWGFVWSALEIGFLGRLPDRGEAWAWLLVVIGAYLGAARRLERGFRR